MVAVAAGGLGMAAVVTPWLVRRLGRRAHPVALVLGALTQLALSVYIRMEIGADRGFLLTGRAR